MRAWLAILILGVASSAEAAILYDATANTTPIQQGWAFLTNPILGAEASQSVSEGVLTLDSFAVASEQAGYFSKIPLILFEHPDSSAIDLGLSPFSIAFSMRQVSGSDTPDSDPLAMDQRNRGGFAVIVISDDLTGIEFQFQADHVIALDNANTAFPVGEVQAFDTTNALHDYELVLSTEGYQLSVDESLLLEGPLRNYSDIAPSSPFNFPYTTSSFLFFGDNTGRGKAVTEITRFAVGTVGDCNYDGVLNSDDLSCVEGIEARDAVLRALNTLPGDLDGNGEVEFPDFLVLSTNFDRQLPSYTDGNIDLIGGVAFADFLVMSTNFGKMPSDMATIPEPDVFFPVAYSLLLALTQVRRLHVRRRK